MPFDYDSIEQQLRLAAKAGDNAAITELLDQGADMNAAPPSGFTAVQMALNYARPDTARLLLERGADVNAAPSSGLTSVQMALRYGHIDIARLLLERGAFAVLDDALTLDQFYMLQEMGMQVAPEPSLQEHEIRLHRMYNRGLLTQQELKRRLEIDLGKRRDPSLIQPTTIEEVEAEYNVNEVSLGFNNLAWQKLKARMQPGDELWKFKGKEYRAFVEPEYEGIVLLRQGRPIRRMYIGDIDIRR